MAKGFPMHTMVDRIGQKSGRLTVVSRGPNKADGSAQWYCQCECGNPELVLLSGNNIKNQRTKSCGCLIVEHAKSLQDNPPEALAAYRNRPTPMATCHPDLPQEAKGLCGPCYNKLKQTYNPERDKANAKERRKNDRYATDGSMAQRRHLKHVYNITPEFFNEMMAEQGGLCAACRLPETAKYRQTELVKRLQIDHDSKCCPGKHSCGKCIRGLLCSSCNMLIGSAKHNPEVLITLAEYVAAGGYRKMKALEQEVERCIGGC